MNAREGEAERRDPAAGASHRGRRPGRGRRDVPEDRRTRRSRRCWYRCRSGRGPPRCTRPRLRDSVETAVPPAAQPSRPSPSAAPTPPPPRPRAEAAPVSPPTAGPAFPQAPPLPGRRQEAPPARPRPRGFETSVQEFRLRPPPSPSPDFLGVSPPFPAPGPARVPTEAGGSAGSGPVAGGAGAGKGAVGVEALAVGETEIALQALVHV